GKSTRMGQEKGLVELKGKPMIQHVLEATAPLGLSQHIIGHHPGYADMGVPVIPDLIPNCGPLGGIYTALTYCRCSHAIIFSCDSPLIQTGTINKLLSKECTGIVIGMISGSLYPFPGIYPVSLLPQVLSSLERQEYKVQGFIEGQTHQVVDLATISTDPHLEFTNVNTLEEVRTFSDFPEEKN
ncbi:molybdenum cofactor guanylyltransferase, partial [Algoriphagus sp. NF]